MNLAHILPRLLPRVEKPSRYLGTEVNAVHKPDAKVRIALAFPDLYDLGLGNLGLHILYAILNRLDGVGAERVYAPGRDMERLLVEHGLRLFALESKDTLDVFDGIGFTLQSELTYTNILNILHLSGIPLRTRDREEGHPLTFAGGPAVFNPEPLSPFMDFFVIGDGEDIVIEIADVLRSVRGRRDRLHALATIPGVYVPALYPTETLRDGRVLPSIDAPRIRKRIARDLNGATFPVDYIVPFTQQVHDRVSLEVLRGCTQGCRFCQAGMTTRPVRERTLENVDQLMARTLERTGYEEVSLVSLSTCDYSQVRGLVKQAVDRAAPERVSISLPSLRLDSFSVELADMVAGIRRTGLTFAPEAASPRLRALINKWIPDDDLLNMATEAYARGWDHVKLYFMIGLPTERDDDIEAIADLTLRVLDVGRRHNRRAKVHTGVSTFVPKPFTPFQWAAQIDMAETGRRQDILGQVFRRNPNIKFGRHHSDETFLEGLVSRGDRRSGDLIEAAWRRGARFDAWDEHRRVGIWMDALEETGLSPAELLGERALDARLPWDHIDILMDKQWFVDDWKRALVLEHAQDCRHSKCHRCGVIDHERPLCASMLRDNIAGRKAEKDWAERHPRQEVVSPNNNPSAPPARMITEPPPVQRLVFRVGYQGEARFVSHLEALSAWIRTIRRAKAPISYSEGFHPLPRLAFASAHPVGEESVADYMDVLLRERVRAEDLLARLTATAPEGFLVLSVAELPINAPSLMSQVTGACYSFFVEESALPEGGLEAAAERLLGAERWPVERRGKEGERKIVDLRPLIRSVIPGPVRDGIASVDVELVAGDGPSARPNEVLGALGLDPTSARVLRRETRLRGSLMQPAPVEAEIGA